MASIWQMQPVQTAAKYFAAGCAVGTTMFVARKVSSMLRGDSTSACEGLAAELDSEEARTYFKQIVELDPDMGEILARLGPFQRFSKRAFKELLSACANAVTVRDLAYGSKITATKAFQVRRSYQKIIESIRILRAIVEPAVGLDIEDFDEVAVDFNAKVEQACTDIIQDQF